MKIFHVCEPEVWAEAMAFGSIGNPSLDTEGFIHCATADQLDGVRSRFYAGRDDYLIVTVDTDLLDDVECRWEAPSHPDGSPNTTAEAADRFPHIYGGIPLDAVVEVREP